MNKHGDGGSGVAAAGATPGRFDFAFDDLFNIFGALLPLQQQEKVMQDDMVNDEFMADHGFTPVDAGGEGGYHYRCMGNFALVASCDGKPVTSPGNFGFTVNVEIVYHEDGTPMPRGADEYEKADLASVVSRLEFVCGDIEDVILIAEWLRRPDA